MTADEVIAQSLLSGEAVYLSRDTPAWVLEQLEELAIEVYDEYADGSVLDFVGRRGKRGWRVIVGERCRASSSAVALAPSGGSVLPAWPEPRDSLLLSTLVRERLGSG